MRPIVDSLATAFDRIDDFRAVQAQSSPAGLAEAVRCLQESVGIVDETRAELRARLERISGSSTAPGHVLLGVIVGLIAAELDAESRGRAEAPSC